MRIAVVGYGCAGIAAAIHLRRDGHQLEHFERVGTQCFQRLSRILTPVFQSDSRILAWLRDSLSAPIAHNARIKRRLLAMLCER